MSTRPISFHDVDSDSFNLPVRTQCDFEIIMHCLIKHAVKFIIVA